MLYSIKASLDTRKHLLIASESLLYRNNSPDTLRDLWLMLHANAFRSQRTTFSREIELMHNYDFSFARREELGYMDVKSVQFVLQDRTIVHPLPESLGQATRLQLWLPFPLVPGESVLLAIDFEVKIPAFFSRLGHRGCHYVVSQWYPQVAVYEPVPDGPSGAWNAPDYHALGEFYGEFASYDVWLTLPAEFVVGATGSPVGRSLLT
ncbi:MAG: hypothetical protein ABIK62_07060, partial [candidate division WOR-3 bacterium]